MTITEILKAVEAPLKTWANENKATVKICGDRPQLFHALYSLSQAPGRTSIFLLPNSGANRADVAQYAREDFKFSIILSRGQAFTLDRAASMIDGAAGGRALFDLLEEVREIVRAVVLADPADEPTPLFTGWSSFEAGEWITDALQNDFTVARNLPDLAAATEEES